MSKHSLETLRNTFSTLLSNKQATASNKQQIIEALTSLTESLVWGDQNDSSLFNHFASQNIIQVYSSLLIQEFDKKIIIQLLQSASILIHNIKSVDSKDYLLRSQFFKEILSHPLDFADHEIVDNYMNLLKGLSVNLNREQLRGYVLDNNFTLFTGAMIFFNYSEDIVKTTSRSVVLSILNLNDENINGFILNSGFFFNLVNHLKESIINISRNIASSKSVNKLEHVITEVLDLLYEFNDIFDLDNRKINDSIKDALLKLLILPILASSIIEEKPKAYHLPMPISIYAFGLILKVLDYIPLRKEILKILFSENLPKHYFGIMTNPPNRSSNLDLGSEESVQNTVQLLISSFLKCSEDNLLGLSLSLVQAFFSKPIEHVFDGSGVELDELVNKLLNDFKKIFVAEEEHRFFSHFLAVKLAYQLFNLNFLQGKLDELLAICNSALGQKARVVMNLIENSQNPVEFVQVFQSEWKFVVEQPWDDYFNLPLNYILPNISESSKIPLELRRSTSESDYNRTEIRLILLYKYFKQLIFPTSESEFTFPLSGLETCSLAVGEFYDVDSEALKGKNAIKVIEKGITGHVRYVLDDKKYLILASLHSDLDCYLVENCFRFSKINLQDMPEPNVIMIKIDENKNLMLVFDEAEKWLMVKNKFEKRMKECREFDVEVLKRFVME